MPILEKKINKEIYFKYLPSFRDHQAYFYKKSRPPPHFQESYPFIILAPKQHTALLSILTS